MSVERNADINIVRIVLLIACLAQISGCLNIEKSTTGFNRLALLEPKAQAGDPEAQFLMGKLYSTGYDWPRDLEKAMDWYTKAAEQEHVRAQVYLGLAWEIGMGDISPDKERAFHWYQRAANHGNSQALAFLGRAYQRGIGTERDQEKSFGYFLQAAELGDGKAQYWTAKSLHRGKGTAQDAVSARAWYLISIENIVDGTLIQHAKKSARAISNKLSKEDNEKVDMLVVSYHLQQNELTRISGK